MKKRRRRINCRVEGCSASFSSMKELFKHKKEHGQRKTNTETNLTTSLLMEKARLNSELLRTSADLQIANRTLDIIKLLLEPVKLTVGVQVVRAEATDAMKPE